MSNSLFRLCLSLKNNGNRSYLPKRMAGRMAGRMAAGPISGMISPYLLAGAMQEVSHCTVIETAPANHRFIADHGTFFPDFTLSARTSISLSTNNILVTDGPTSVKSSWPLSHQLSMGRRLLLIPPLNPFLQ